MALPGELKNEFHEKVEKYEKEKKMRYVTSFERNYERRGETKGLKEAVIDCLEVRFNSVPAAIAQFINMKDDLAELKQLHKKAVLVESLEQFQKGFQQNIRPI